MGILKKFKLPRPSTSTTQSQSNDTPSTSSVRHRSPLPPPIITTTPTTPPAIKKKKNRRKSFFSFISPSEVTEDSLEVWRHLPSKIRHDPSMVSFQMQNEKLHGNVPEEEEEVDIEEEESQMKDNDGSDHGEFIEIKVKDNQQPPESLDEDEICHDPKAVHGLDDHNNHDIHLHESYLHDSKPTSPFKKYLKLVCLLIVWIAFTAILTSKEEKEIIHKHISIMKNENKFYELPTPLYKDHFVLFLEGSFSNTTKETGKYLKIVAQIIPPRDQSNKTGVRYKGLTEILPKIAEIPIETFYKLDQVESRLKRHIFEIDPTQYKRIEKNSTILLTMSTNLQEDFGVQLGVDTQPVDITTGVILAAILLIVLYGLLIFDVVHRTFAVFMVSTMSVAALAALDDRPIMDEIIKWIDVETILLLFAMMILVAILTETGIFDYLAVYTYKITNGKIWPLIHSLCIITALLSTFLDNVTTVLLMTPITIRLCEVMELNPIPVLMGVIIHANIGGTMTPIGDPPNIIIMSNAYIAKHGITFTNFTVHMSLGSLLIILQTCIQLRLQYCHINDLRFKEPKQIKDLRREITVWTRASTSLSPFSKDVNIVRDTLDKKVKILQHELKIMLTSAVSTERYKATLEELQQNYPIKNKVLLIKSLIVLVFIVILFFVESIPEIHNLSLGWSALIGVILLLIICERDDMDAMMHRIEWTTLLFFAAMFIIMEAVERLGLILWIGSITENIVRSVSPESRLAVAIIIILWISAITSAFVDSIPVTTMMVKIVVTLAEAESLKLPLQPLVWALAFGSCLGGNGTIIGASANIVCAGIAEQHGYSFTFMEYFKVGFPIMIASVIVITGYLMFFHVLFDWNY